MKSIIHPNILLQSVNDLTNLLFGFLYSSAAFIHAYESGNLAEGQTLRVCLVHTGYELKMHWYFLLNIKHGAQWRILKCAKKGALWRLRVWGR